MILFVFEGKKREPELFRTMEKLFFQGSQNIVCSFGNNIYELYRQMKALDDAGDIVSLLVDKYRGHADSPFGNSAKSSDFSEIYLVFDYDFHNTNILAEGMNSQLEEMLDMFDNETENGKLYINYPMVEAIRYTKKLPDSRFHKYTVSRHQCLNSSFKKIADEFSDYKSLDFLSLSNRRPATDSEMKSRTNNWNLIKEQHVAKANFLCTGNLTRPEAKDDISQKAIFNAQLQKHVLPNDSVSILSAFPLFLFEYFPC